jgi:dihydrofolate reductase
VIADISMSLDGFVTGPDPGPDQGLGAGGEALHTWALGSDDPVDADVLRGATEATGAVVMGRRLFDIVDAPQGWNDEMGYGAGLAAAPPFFVVTHDAPEHVRLDLPFTFVTTGLRAALDQARAAAGDRDVVVMGGADVVRQCIDEGVADELRIHLAPIVLGRGTALFTGSRRRPLRQLEARASATATHLVYAIEDRGLPVESPAAGVLDPSLEDPPEPSEPA